MNKIFAFGLYRWHRKEEVRKVWGITWFLNILTGIVFFIDYGVFKTYGGTAANLMMLGYFSFLVLVYGVEP